MTVIQHPMLEALAFQERQIPSGWASDGHHRFEVGSQIWASLMRDIGGE